MSDIAFAAIDWGTTTYRLWLIDSMGALVRDSSGPAGLNSDNQRNFESEVEAALSALSCPNQVPVLMCGMIGAAQGWIEAPYQIAPCDFNELGQKTVQAKADRDIRILPGICQHPPNAPDVMRGEETILAGLLALRKGANLGSFEDECSLRVCLPGTHSKWATVEKGSLKQFQTYMTGEVFALLSEKSVLSVFTSAHGGAAYGPAFETGALEAYSAPKSALSLIFSCRSMPLVLGTETAEDMRARLSGLVIGLELSGALEREECRPILLVSSGDLADLYRRALDAVGVAYKSIDAEEATRTGLIQFARSIWPRRFNNNDRK